LSQQISGGEPKKKNKIGWLGKKIRSGIENFVFAENFSKGVKFGEKGDGRVRFWILRPYQVI